MQIYTESVIVRDTIRAGRPTVLLLVGIEPLEALLAFFRERCASLVAERSYVQAVGRFIEWLSVRAEEFYSQDQRYLLYTAFLHDLRFGTYRQGIDKYGLNWRPTSDSNLRRLTRCLFEFSDWLSKRQGTIAISPIRQNASYSDQIVFWRYWNKRKATSLLGHIKRRRHGVEIERTPTRIVPRQRNKHLAEAKAFPIKYIDALLWQGFARPGNHAYTPPWQKFNLRDILITLLCLYGGCRESEPMHLWVDDVFVDPDDPDVALVLIHEPETGIVNFTDPLTGTKRKTTRSDFLQRHCGGRIPLTQETGRRHAGWKGALLTHRERNAFQVFWIDRGAGRLFLELWRMYLHHIRPVTLQMPWAFLTRDGQPLGTEGFNDSFNAAVQRIGLFPSKHAGTTTHGLRHRYGQWLNDLGLGEKEGQVAMHHLNAKSQDFYRQLGVAQVAAVVGAATDIASLPSFIKGCT
ncbi:hypothetical protein GEOBRER4_n1993 [Citrifermentans bremense]|uniref:Tyr recombinase domain-containing protein n=1 Tax=Citrifermentans bremense TaxID=60035 RepID=A0A7R7FTD7_9BACT|nr:gamma-mobile-trio recombinase GmtY [Citrifermentans bremense]BCO11378.1 hypothetical protein GEOBRER4_n1993 [Citrifermentans bremense]